MGELVAIDLPGGPAFLGELHRAWDRGDAVLPLDQRLPGPARARLLASARPASIVSATGTERLPPAEGEPLVDGDALVMATSGSTGTPKAVVLTHDALRASAVATGERLGVTASDCWLGCLPVSHIGGFSVITKALATGVPLVLHAGFDADEVVAAARAGATLVSLVPTTLARIDPAVFRVVVLGGSRPPSPRPANVVATYGLTETGSGVVYDGVPLPGVEVRIATDGEVLVRGPMLMRAYRDGTSPIDAEGWLHTDDAGVWTDEGTLHVLGRRGDLIITGGENVWPDMVERVIGTHPAVAEVCVAGVEDAEWGQRVVAWVVPVEASRPPTLEQVREVVRREIPAFMAPRELVLVDALPRTPLGKVVRQTLVDRRSE